MSTYKDFLSVIDGLTSGTTITITQEWCTNYGLIVDANMMKSWGIKFSKDFSLHGCSHHIVSPTQGTAGNKSVNNLKHYIKN